MFREDVYFFFVFVGFAFVLKFELSDGLVGEGV